MQTSLVVESESKPGAPDDPEVYRVSQPKSNPVPKKSGERNRDPKPLGNKIGLQILVILFQLIPVCGRLLWIYHL